MIITIALILLYLLTPVVIIYLTHISKPINKIGAVVMAYGVGLLIGNIGIFPRPGEAYRNLTATNAALPKEELLKHFEAGSISANDVLVNQIASTQDLIMSVVILLAIPLLLFSLDIRRWLKLAREAFKSLVLAMVSLFAVIFLGYFLLGDKIPESWKVAGMLVGIYTGGTPNLAAIGTAVDVSPNVFILTHTYDLVIGAICLLFLMTIAQRVFNLFLPTFSRAHRPVPICKIVKESEGVDNYIGMLNLRAALRLGFALLMAFIIVGISYALGSIVPKNAQMTVIILSITTLGLLLSLIKRVNQIENTFQLGMYFIIVFSMTVSSMADLRSMFQIQFLDLFLYVALAVFGSMIIHVGLSKLFNVDTDTTIITITALTYSPPFVPVVAAAIRNKEIIISGLTVGILGYAFGNYAGVTIAYLLKGM